MQSLKGAEAMSLLCKDHMDPNVLNLHNTSCVFMGCPEGSLFDFYIGAHNEYITYSYDTIPKKLKIFPIFEPATKKHRVF